MTVETVVLRDAVREVVRDADDLSIISGSCTWASVRDVDDGRHAASRSWRSFSFRPFHCSNSRCHHSTSRCSCHRSASRRRSSAWWAHGWAHCCGGGGGDRGGGGGDCDDGGDDGFG